MAKTLRDIEKPKEERKHCCGMTIQNEGIGYKDLDELFARPCDLEFIIGELEKFITDFKSSFSNVFFFNFSSEIISIDLPNEYEKESWQLSEDERVVTVRKNRELGNDLYRKGQIKQAEEKYKQALGIVEQQLMKLVIVLITFHSKPVFIETLVLFIFFREKPHDVDWLELVKIKIPLLLNYAQCKLLQKEYYEVIEHCSEVLKHEPSKILLLTQFALP